MRAQQSNPARRLYVILIRFREVADTNRSLADLWAEVLGVEAGQVAMKLAMVGYLIPTTRRSLEGLGHAEQLETFDHFAPNWLEVLLWHDRNPHSVPSAAPKLLRAGSLQALGSIASFLDLAAPEGSVPDADQLGALRAGARDLLEQVIASSDLPPTLRRTMSNYLHRLLWLLDEIQIVGPGEVEALCEQLLGQSLLMSESDRTQPIWRKIISFASRIYTAFKAGPEVHQAIEAWQDIAKQLPSGS